MVGAAQLVKTPDELSCLRRASPHHRTSHGRRAESAGARAYGRPICQPQLVRRAFELGATTNMLEAIWQVMPTSRAEGVWTTHGDLALPLLTAERELVSR